MSEYIKYQRTERTQLPVHTSSETFTVKDQKYVVLRYPENKGPNLKQAIEIENSIPGKKLLTGQEAREIISNDELKVAFEHILKIGEWTYVRDSGTESQSRAAYLIFLRFRCGVHFDSLDSIASPVVILKETSKDIVAPKDPELLRKTEA